MYEGIGLDAIAPIFSRFFLPYGCSLVMASPPVRMSSTGSSEGPAGRSRAMSLSTGWAVTVKENMKAQIMHLFADTHVSVTLRFLAKFRRS